MREICAGTNLSTRTVIEHKKEINIGNWLPDLKVATPRILQALAGEALKGEVKAARLWLQYVEGWNPRDPDGTALNADVIINIGYGDDDDE